MLQDLSITRFEIGNYRSSVDYVARKWMDFDFQVYYYKFYPGFDREQTEKKLKNDIDGCVFEFINESSNFTDWYSNQQENGYPVRILIVYIHNIPLSYIIYFLYI
jgi:hypothetical protein